jgi:hypothetical protein
MHEVFVAGSRALSRLNSEIRKRLDNIVRQKFTILIGDANGADKAVQTYLAQLQYTNVVVYCMGTFRNNVGHWTIRSHSADPNMKRDRFYYGIKDKAMASDATCGFMLWDGNSKVTLTNTVELIHANKTVLLYVSKSRRFFTLKSVEEFHSALRLCGIKDPAVFLSSKGIETPISPPLPFDTENLSPQHASSGPGH